MAKGVPIGRTEMAIDPHSPITESHVPTLLKSQLDESMADIVGTIDLRTVLNGAGPVLMRINELIKEGKKIIADEIFDITPMILSVKYYDDGNYIRGAGAIAMNDYTIEDIDKFREAIYCKFNILTTVHSRKIVYIPKKEFISFKDIVLPFATSDVLYKLGELLES